MTQSELEKFKEVIYKPYTEAWELMKYMRDKEPKNESFWQDYFARCEDFNRKYSSEIGGSIYRVLLDAGSEVMRIGKMQEERLS